MKSPFNKVKARVLLFMGSTGCMFLVGACSLYQSDGRKFLEKQAYEYSGVSDSLEQCRPSAESEGLALVNEDARARVFQLSPAPQTPDRIRVIPTANRPYSCDYGFTSRDHMQSSLQPAVDLTVERMSLDIK